MKVGVKVTVFNFAMRNRRAELGFSQARLAEFCHMSLHEIITIEALRAPQGKAFRVAEKLNSIAVALETEFPTLFPQDYLDMLQAKLLPRRRQPYIWCREMRLEELSTQDIQLQLPPAEEIAFGNLMADGLNRVMSIALTTLTDREREVIEMRFGLKDGLEHTLEEVGQRFDVTRARIRQIEEKALRKMRHPNRSDSLRAYL